MSKKQRGPEYVIADVLKQIAEVLGRILDELRGIKQLLLPKT